jgi:broad specificity phosphatase PhoE
VIDFLTEIKEGHAGETVAIVSHGFVLAVMRAIYQSGPTTNLFSLVPHNGEIISIDLPG